MTDEHLDRLVRDADPHRPDVIGRLDGAEQTLLEEIMSTPILDDLAEPPPPPSRARRSVIRRTAATVAAAAALTGILAVSTGLRDRPGDRPLTAPASAPAGIREDRGATLGGTPVVYSAAVIKAAEANPRLLIDQPGWEAKTVYGFAEESGTIGFVKGGRTLEMTWYPAGQYDGYRRDRLNVSPPEPATVDGWAGEMFRYSVNDFAVMLRPRDGAFVELRTAGAWNEANFDQVLADIVRADVRTWLAALPAAIVTPGRVADQAAKVLAGVPLPPGFDEGELAGLGTNDPYQFGARVTSLVGCGWIAEWLRADRAGDKAARERAGAALRGSREWPVLKRLENEGGWSDVFWETAEDVADGRPGGWASALGCD
jgi:hypothetical protein